MLVLFLACFLGMFIDGLGEAGWLKEVVIVGMFSCQLKSSTRQR
ncbi:hypothetical protein VIBNIAM115_1420025 [Vibrio nigripulchritudo AM115]|nr:hypothetical protein VIBNIAM115_1420025 [Vibrio nigripulchritudo AM115]